MNEIIKFDNGQLAQEAILYIIAKEEQMNAIKAEYDTFKANLLAKMEHEGIIKIEADNVIINYIAESERETFDSKSFRADMPDLFNEYVKLSAVKPSIRIKIK